MAPQNVRQKFTFVKVLTAVCEKMARNGLKMANSQHCDLLRYPVFSISINHSDINFISKETARISDNIRIIGWTTLIFGILLFIFHI